MDPELIRERFIEEEFKIHSKRTTYVREQIRLKKEAIVSLYDVYVEKFNALPKWLRILLSVITYIFVGPILLCMIDGLIKLSADEWIKLAIAIMLMTTIWAALKWVVIV